MLGCRQGRAVSFAVSQPANRWACFFLVRNPILRCGAVESPGGGHAAMVLEQYTRGRSLHHGYHSHACPMLWWYSHFSWRESINCLVYVGSEAYGWTRGAPPVGTSPAQPSPGIFFSVGVAYDISPRITATTTKPANKDMFPRIAAALATATDVDGAV